MKVLRCASRLLVIAIVSGAFAAHAVAAKAFELGEALVLGDLYVLPAPDLSKIEQGPDRAGRPDLYGVIVPFWQPDLDQALGQWQELRDGRARWQWSVASPGAYALEFQFSTLRLPPSAVLTVRGEDKQTTRTVTADDVARERFRSPFVVGERASLVLDVEQSERALVEMALESVTHAYRSPFGGGAAEKSASCHVDVACSVANGWEDQIAATAMYTFPYNGGATAYCSSTLMANTDNSEQELFLTANHCLDSQAEAEDVTVYWNYDNYYCRTTGSASSGTPIGTGNATHTQSGATLRATWATTDFTLLELDLPVAGYAIAYYAGWDRNFAAPTSTTSIHHPKGHEKRFSRDNQAPTVSADGGATGTGNGYWRVADWDAGITESGSSGGALFSQSRLVIGQLASGTSSCNGNWPDWYGRIAVSWAGGGTNATRLSNWLDPFGTGALSKSGYYQTVTGIAPSAKKTDLFIPSLATVESSQQIIGMAGNGGLNSRVKVRINHTYVGDLKLELIAPDGDVYLLHNYTGGARDNLHETYIRNLSGSPKSGLWKLRINDKALGDDGLLDYWALKL